MTTAATLTPVQKQNALLPAATKTDDAARLCAGAMDALDTATAGLRAAGVHHYDLADLDAAAGLVAEARKKLHAAHTLVIGVALK